MFLHLPKMEMLKKRAGTKKHRGRRAAEEEEEEEGADVSGGREEIVISSLHIGNRIRPSRSSSLQVTSALHLISLALYLSTCPPVHLSHIQTCR